MAATRQVRVERVVFHGLGAFELRTARARLVVVTEVGPRIAHLSLGRGPNLFFWDDPPEKKRGDWVLRGGHRLWVTRPHADEAEETYAADNLATTVRVQPHGLTVTSRADASAVSKSLTITAIDARRFEITHRLSNRGDMLWSGGAWALTCTRPTRGARYGIPLGGDGEWDAFSVVIPRRWGGDHSSLVDDPQLRWREHCLVINPRGIESKRMLEAPRGVLGMSSPAAGCAFVKQARRIGGEYPLDTNVAYYVAPANFMVELETMSPIQRLRPGETLTHVERWSLEPEVDWEDPRAVLALVSRVSGPRSSRQSPLGRALARSSLRS